MVGSILADRYEIRALLGEGAMASVYDAFDRRDNRVVAIKVPRDSVLASSELRARFEREARTATQADHPALVRAYGLGHTEDGVPYLVFERATGEDLVRALAPLPTDWRRAFRVGAQIASAALALHARGIVHRDLKPDNILLGRAPDGSEQIKLLDFGVAKTSAPHDGDEEGMTRLGHVYGTPEYMAPEQALGQAVDERADVYSLGVILFELLTGRRPYIGKAKQLLGQQLTQPIPAFSDLGALTLPSELEALIHQMLTVSCAERPSMSAVRERLLELAGRDGDHKEKPRRAPGGSAPPRLAPRAPRVALVAAISLAVGGLGALLWIERARVEPVSLPSAPDQPGSTAEAPAAIVQAESQPLSPKALSEAPLDELITLSRKHSSEPLIQLALARAYLDAKDYASAVETAAAALALDPSLNRSHELAFLFVKTAQLQSSQDATFRLLKGPMGQEGADILYQLSSDPSTRPLVRAQASAALASPELRENLSLALALALDLAAARSCKELFPLFERAELFGDRRSLSRLEGLQKNLDCKRRGLPCYPCLRQGPALERAIAAIRARELAANGGSQPERESLAP